jgi:hypothetical protein
MSYGKIRCEKVRLSKKRIFGKGHQMTCVLQRQRERGGRDKEREREKKREREKEKARERERLKRGCRKKKWRNLM